MFHCGLCDRWFCEEHIEPRLAFIKDLDAIEKIPEISALYHTEIQGKENGHPDFEYSRRKIVELDLEEKRRSELIEQALNRMNTHYSMKSHQGTEELEKEENIIGRALPEVAEEKSKNGIISEGKFHFRKAEVERPRKKRHFPIRKVIGIMLAIVIIGALLWYAPTIISYFQNPSNSSGSYTTLMFREMMNTSATIEFGDTDYDLDYHSMTDVLSVSTFIGGSKDHWRPQKGDVYNDFGIEAKVSDIGSDYISDYMVILVRPTIQNYMASLHYTRVNLTLYQSQSVHISSGLINKTNTYSFTYTQDTSLSITRPQLEIRNATQSKAYYVFSTGSTTILDSPYDFDIEVRVYKIESTYMVIYVKPLY